MTTTATRSPFTPADPARRDRILATLRRLDELTYPDAGHYFRARTRVAALHGFADVTDEQLEAAVTDTAPPECL